MNRIFGLGKRLKKKSIAGIAAGVLAAAMLIGEPCLMAAELTMVTDGNVRKEASTSSDKVASASSGSTYTIEGETTGSDGNKWYQISVNGSTGYVREDLVSVSDGGGDAATSSSVLSSSAAMVAVKTDATNVRSGPSTSDSVVTKVDAGIEYSVIGETMDDSGNLWYQIDVNGQSGYLRSDTVEVTQQASEGGDTESEEVEEPAENTTTISSVVSSRILPEGSNLEQMTIDLATLQSWESGNYYVLYTKSSGDANDPGEWYLYSIEDNQFQRIATLDADTEDVQPKKKTSFFKGNNRLILVIAGVLVVAIILAIIFVLLRRRDSGMYEEMDSYDDEDEEEEVYQVPSKRSARGGSRRDPAPRNFLSRKNSDYYEDDEDEEEEEDDEEVYAPRKGRRIMAPGRDESSRGSSRRAAPRSKARRYEEEDDEEEYMDDDDFEFEFLNDK